jgi:hypothetical protein
MQRCDRRFASRSNKQTPMLTLEPAAAKQTNNEAEQTNAGRSKQTTARPQFL